MIEIKTQPVATADLQPYERNPRAISDKAISAVALSIQRFGFRQPIIADRKNVIIAGHTRHQAALRLGLEQVPVHYFDGSEDDARALRLADNRARDFSMWDYEQRHAELKLLSDTAFTLLDGIFDKAEMEIVIKEDRGITRLPSADGADPESFVADENENAGEIGNPPAADRISSSEAGANDAETNDMIRCPGCGLKFTPVEPSETDD